MADETKPAPLPILGIENAPVVYFESLPTYAVISGVLSILLTIRVAVPNDTAPTKVGSVQVAVGHLRCNIEAAVGLRDTIDRALAMTAPAPEGVVVN